MTVDSSPASRPTRIPGKNNTVKEKKMALVAQRLAMLHDDKTGELTHMNPVPVECPKQHERTHSVSDCKEDLLSDSDNLVSCPSASRGKYGSRKRTMVIRDEEFGEDEKCHGLIQPAKKERAGRKRPKKSNPLNASPKPSKRSIINIVEQTDDSLAERSSVMMRAREIQANLFGGYPSFARAMKPTYVAGSWLNLPGNICNDFLPERDCDVVLVNEGGRKFKIKFLLRMKGFRCGWKDFVVEHKLCVDDVVVFCRIASTTFQTYIVRKHCLDEVDGTLGLPTRDACGGQRTAEIDSRAHTVSKAKVSPPRDFTSLRSSSVDLGPEVLNGICLLDSDANFEAIKRFEDFNIIVNGLMLDSRFSEDNRKKYYELCYSQNSFLHEHLISLNCGLVEGIIMETINISDAIRACTSSTSNEDLQIWIQTLKGFELFGMKVDFLLTKLHQLQAVTSKSDMADESIMFGRYIREKAYTTERIRALENQLTDVKERLERINQDMEAEMTACAKKHTGLRR